MRTLSTLPLLLAACTGGGATDDDSADTADTAQVDTGTADTSTIDTSTVDTATGALTTDTFLFERDEVDVLLVVDNSCSMADDQAEMAAHAGELFDFLVGSGVDYRVAVTSTDPGGVDCFPSTPSAGELATLGGMSWVDATSPDPVLHGAQLMQLGTGGCDLESGLDTAYQAVTDPTSSFRRVDAPLAILFASDEDDHSDALTTPAITDADRLAWLDGIAADVPLSVHGVLCLDGTPACQADRYQDVVDHLGGPSWDITDGAAQWPLAFEQLGADALGVTRSLALSTVPDPATLVVGTVSGGVETVVGFDSYDAGSNSVLLTVWPSPGEEWYVRYTPL